MWETIVDSCYVGSVRQKWMKSILGMMSIVKAQSKVDENEPPHVNTLTVISVSVHTYTVCAITVTL